tara:strand:+ start:138 stop:305 length:168 start_codon:yes stop_codon:yes gene_type:complete
LCRERSIPFFFVEKGEEKFADVEFPMVVGVVVVVVVVVDEEEEEGEGGGEDEGYK